jgi:hypothetical protein
LWFLEWQCLPSVWIWRKFFKQMRFDERKFAKVGVDYIFVSIIFFALKNAGGIRSCLKITSSFFKTYKMEVRGHFIYKRSLLKLNSHFYHFSQEITCFVLKQHFSVPCLWQFAMTIKVM